MKFNIWEIIIIVLMVLSLGMDAQRHGEPKKGTHSFWISLTANIITLILFYFAGLFHGR